MHLCQAPHRPAVEMVVVVVRLQDDIEGWQVFERDPRRNPTPRAGKLDWRCALTPHRVGEDVETVKLDEQARVSNPGHRELRPCRAGRDKVGRDAREHRWIRILGPRPRRAMHEHPLEETAEPRHSVIDPWIAKTTAGAVVWRDGGSSHGAQYSRAVTRRLRGAVRGYVDDGRVGQPCRCFECDVMHRFEAVVHCDVGIERRADVAPGGWLPSGRRRPAATPRDGDAAPASPRRRAPVRSPVHSYSIAIR